MVQKYVTIIVPGLSWLLANVPITVSESLGMPVTGSPSTLKGYHNSLIDGSPSILVSPMG